MEEFTANISNVEMFLGDSNIPADKEFVDFAVAEGLIDKTEEKSLPEVPFQPCEPMRMY